MSKVKFTVIFAAGAVAGAFGMYALNVALARDGGALGGEALVIPLVVLLLWAGYCLGHAKETVAELLDLPTDEIEPADNGQHQLQPIFSLDNGGCVCGKRRDIVPVCYVQTRFWCG